MFGDIVKVTPTSKSVGDMALFMVANDVSSNDILNGERDYSYPASVVDLISGAMGLPPGGFPEKVKQRILNGKPSFEGRPGDTLPPADFAAERGKLKTLLGHEPSNQEVLSSILYPRVFEDFAKHRIAFSDTSELPTPVFFYGMEAGEEIAVAIEAGKTLIIRYLTTGIPHPDGRRSVFFELNGQPRDVMILDRAEEPKTPRNPKGDLSNLKHIVAQMPGMVYTTFKRGDTLVGGMMPQGKELVGAPSTWNVYFSVADADQLCICVCAVYRCLCRPT